MLAYGIVFLPLQHALWVVRPWVHDRLGHWLVWLYPLVCTCEPEMVRELLYSLPRDTERLAYFLKTHVV